MRAYLTIAADAAGCLRRVKKEQSPSWQFYVMSSKTPCNSWVSTMTHETISRGLYLLLQRYTALSFKPGVAKLFDPRAEFAAAWPMEGRIQCDLRNLGKNGLLKCEMYCSTMITIKSHHCGPRAVVWPPLFQVAVLFSLVTCNFPGYAVHSR